MHPRGSRPWHFALHSWDFMSNVVFAFLLHLPCVRELCDPYRRGKLTRHGWRVAYHLVRSVKTRSLELPTMLPTCLYPPGYKPDALRAPICDDPKAAAQAKKISSLHNENTGPGSSTATADLAVLGKEESMKPGDKHEPPAPKKVVGRKSSRESRDTTRRRSQGKHSSTKGSRAKKAALGNEGKTAIEVPISTKKSAQGESKASAKRGADTTADDGLYAMSTAERAGYDVTFLQVSEYGSPRSICRICN